MKTLANRNGSYLTGTALADAVFRYAFALAQAREIDVVEIPIRTEGGAVVRLQLTVGWQADVNTVEHPTDDAELVDEKITRDVDDRAERLRWTSQPFTAEELADLSWMNIC